MSTWVTTYIALGSNLDDPTSQLRRAINALDQLPHSILVAKSSLHSSKPVGFVKQPDFINAVVCLKTQLLPEVLLSHLHAIEQAQGRVRLPEQRFGPRTLDLDLLLYGDQIIQMPNLTVPHYAMYDRPFVLVPLNEIAPDLVLPNGKRVKECL